jgi:GTPase SAR1 family protein
MNWQTKRVSYGQKRIRLTLYDGHKEQKMGGLIRSYYRGSDGIILLYRVGDRPSFQDAQEEMDIVGGVSWKTMDVKVVKFLVGLHLKGDKREVEREEGQQLASNNDCLFLEVKLEDPSEVNLLFTRMIS